EVDQRLGVLGDGGRGSVDLVGVADGVGDEDQQLVVGLGQRGQVLEQHLRGAARAHLGGPVDLGLVALVHHADVVAGGGAGDVGHQRRLAARQLGRVQL